MIRKFHNLIGKTFGLGKVVAECGTRTIGHGKYPRTFQEWELICECGKHYTTTTQHLQAGLTRSCGCLRRENLVGKTFGKSRVIKFLGHKTRGLTPPRSCPVWELKCECGNTFEAITEFLKNGDVGSCGCSKQFHNHNPKTLKQYFRTLKDSAKSRQKPFLISIEFLDSLLAKQNNLCALSSLPISLDDATASVDRIDNDKGYTPDNVHWVSRKVNYMKGTLKTKEFIDLCKLIYFKSSSGIAADS